MAVGRELQIGRSETDAVCFFLSPSFKIFTVFKNDFRAYAVGSNAHRTVHRVPASGK